MIQKVIKGVDDEIEFKGFKGRYFYLLASSVMAILFITFLLYMVGFSSIWLLIISAASLAVISMYIKVEMGKNGKWGHIQHQHKNKKPTYILQNHAFYRLIKHEKSKEN